MKTKNTLSIQTTVYRHTGNQALEFTLVRTTKTMLILEAANGDQVRLGWDGQQGGSKRSRCYSIKTRDLMVLLAQLPVPGTV